MNRSGRAIPATVAVLGAVLALGGCQPKTNEPVLVRNTCYHIGYPEGGEKKYNPVKANITSVEFCAAELEKLRMLMAAQGVPHETIDGVYNGNYLFIDRRYVKLAKKYDGYRVTLLVKTNDGRLVMPGAVVVSDDPEQPSSVTEPKDLPR